MKMQEVQVAITKIKISTVQFRMRCTESVFFLAKKVFLIFTHTNMLVFEYITHDVMPNTQMSPYQLGI